MKKAVLTGLFITGSMVLLMAQRFEGNAQDIARIKKNIAAFSGYVMASDYHGIAASYTEDGKIMPNGTPIISGYEAIKKRWTLPEGVQITYHKVMPEEIRIVDGHAYDYGYYEGTTKRVDGSEVSWKGKYVIVWRKVENEWKIYLDIWNRVD